jgi:hypothetical protein
LGEPAPTTLVQAEYERHDQPGNQPDLFSSYIVFLVYNSLYFLLGKYQSKIIKNQEKKKVICEKKIVKKKNKTSDFYIWFF